MTITSTNPKRKPKRILRPKVAWKRLGIGHSKFWQDFIKTGKLKLVRLGPRSVGVFEDELDEVMDALPVANEPE